MNIKPIKSTKCALFAPSRNTNIYDDYVDDRLLPAKKKKFEQHFEKCPICAREVVKAFQLDEKVRKSPLMSAEGQKRSLNRKLKYLDEIFGRNDDDVDFVKDAEPLALAASPPRRLDCKGVAYGVAVDPDAGQGALLECIAMISDRKRYRSKLEIRAIELKSLKKGGIETKITTPTSYLEEIFEDMFESLPLLEPFRLWEKAIRVEVNYKTGGGYICEADSVALAVMVAIISAVTGKPVDKDVLFSAGIKMNGYLEGVGDLNHKIKIAKNQRMKACFTADETRPVCADNTIKKSGIALHYFDKLEDVLTSLGLIEKRSIKKSFASKRRTADSRNKKK